MAEQPLWTSSEIMAATGGRAKGPFHARGVAIDSREVQKGDLFVALLAARDGHEFVHAAMRAGAAGCLLSQAGHDVPHVKVADTLEALRATDARLTLIREGDHRLSRPQDLALLKQTVDAVCAVLSDPVT